MRKRRGERGEGGYLAEVVVVVCVVDGVVGSAHDWLRAGGLWGSKEKMEGEAKETHHRVVDTSSPNPREEEKEDVGEVVDRDEKEADDIGGSLEHAV
jgi:hypothetical protein